MKTRTLIGATTIVAQLVGGSVSLAGSASADFCGAREDPFVCTARLNNGPPNPTEANFLRVVCPFVPTGDQENLIAGRTVCTQDGATTDYVAREVGSYLGINTKVGAQFVRIANGYLCPNVFFCGG